MSKIIPINKYFDAYYMGVKDLSKSNKYDIVEHGGENTFMDKYKSHYLNNDLRYINQKAMRRGDFALSGYENRKVKHISSLYKCPGEVDFYFGDFKNDYLLFQLEGNVDGLPNSFNLWVASDKSKAEAIYNTLLLEGRFREELIWWQSIRRAA